MPRRSLVTFSALALLTLLAYLGGLVVRFPLNQYASTPLLDLGKIGGYDVVAAASFIVPWFVLWPTYFGAAWVAARSPDVPRFLIWGPALAFSLALVFLYPITAADLFNYALYGLVQHAGFNPIFTAPAEALPGALVRYSAWPHYPSPYGPLWQLISYALTAFGQQDLPRMLLAFKALMVVVHLLNVGLVWRLARSTSVSPPLAALLFGWNPLVLYESIGNGHNDAMVLAFLLLALVALSGQRRAWYYTLILGAMGAAVKLVAFLWYPTLALALWRRLRGPGRAVRVALAGVLAIGVTALLFAPFGLGPDLFSGVNSQARLYTTSPGALVMIVAVERLRLAPAEIVRGTLQFIALWVVGVVWWRNRPLTAEGETLFAGLFDVTLAYLLVGALWFQPWYLVPLWGLACLAGPRRVVLATLFALGGLASYVVYFYVWPYLGWSTSRLVIQAIATAATFLPVLSGLVVLGVGRRLRRRSVSAASPTGFARAAR